MSQYIEETCTKYKPILGNSIYTKEGKRVKSNTLGTISKCVNSTLRLTGTNNCTECTNKLIKNGTTSTN